MCKNQNKVFTSLFTKSDRIPKAEPLAGFKGGALNDIVIIKEKERGHQK